MSYLLTQLQETFDSIDTRISALEGADPDSPTLVGRVSDLEARTGDVESSVVSLGLTAADHAGRLAHLDTLTTEYGSRLATLEAGALETVARFVLAENRIQELENRPATGSTLWPGHAILTDFAGADSTAKMRNALASIANDPAGRKRVLVIPPGTVLAPGATPFAGFSGMAIVGGVIPETEFSYNCRVTISGPAPNGVFIFPVGQTKGVTFANIGWEGPGAGSVCRFLGDNQTDQLSYSVFHGNSFDNFTSVLRRRLLGVIWTGSGYINNSTETPVDVTGSDYKLFMDGLYLDSPNLTDSDYLLHIRSGNKVTVGPVFVTGDGPTPVRVSAGQMIRLNGLEMEAEGVPRKTAGAGLYVSGGNVVCDKAWFFRTMYNPVSTGRGDSGVVTVTGGCLRLNDATFGEYNTTPEKPGGHTENHVSASGSARVYLSNPLPWNMQANSGTGGLSGARALQVAKSGSAQIFSNSPVAL